MKVLMISRDAGIMQEGSDVQKRMAEYGALADELHIVVFSIQHFAKTTIGKNVFAYSTNSLSKWFYIYDAYLIAKHILDVGYKVKIESWLVSTQDPFETGIVGWFVARKYRMPLQLQVHTDLFSPYFARESLLNTIRVWVAQFLILRARGIRAVSERIKRSLASSFKLQASKIIVLPIFVDVQKIKDSPTNTDLHKKYPQFDFIALMASRFTKEKNIPMALSAMAEVVKKYPHAGLVMVGTGPEKKKYETLIVDHRLEKNVIIEAWTDDLVSYYKTADIFVLSSNYEGYGRTPIEAEAAGCSVIMTDVGIAREVVKDGENGIVVPVGDAQTLADAITSVVEKKTVLRASLPIQSTKEAYMRAYKRTWEQCMQK